MNGEFNLRDYDLTVETVHHTLPPSALYEHAIRYEKDASIADNGALVAYSGAKTGRSPKDKRVVKNPESEKDIISIRHECTRRAHNLRRRGSGAVDSRQCAFR